MFYSPTVEELCNRNNVSQKGRKLDTMFSFCQSEDTFNLFKMLCRKNFISDIQKL